MKRCSTLQREESGEIMIESMIVVLMTTIPTQLTGIEDVFSQIEAKNGAGFVGGDTLDFGFAFGSGFFVGAGVVGTGGGLGSSSSIKNSIAHPRTVSESTQRQFGEPSVSFRNSVAFLLI